MILTKQEILQQKDAEFWESEMKDMEVFDQNYPESVCLSAMDKYAKDVCVLFSEWKYKSIVKMNTAYYISYHVEGRRSFENLSELYDYWCENIMNTQQKEIEQ